MDSCLRLLSTDVQCTDSLFTYSIIVPYLPPTHLPTYNTKLAIINEYCEFVLCRGAITYILNFKVEYR